MLQQVFPKEPECIVSREPVSAPGSISQQAGSPTQGYSSDIRILLSQTNITALVPVSTGLSLVSCYQQMEVSSLQSYTARDSRTMYYYTE